MKETLERAVELIGHGDDLPEDEAIGVACGWWPCFPAKAGAYVKLNEDGTGTIVTGAQENGTGAVMALPRYVAEELGMRPEDFSLLYQDTDAAPVGQRLVRLADDVQQRARRARRRGRGARAAARRGIRAARGGAAATSSSSAARSASRARPRSR